MMKHWEKIGAGMIFTVFYIVLLQQFSTVFVYYDDYGYLSLSYGYRVEDVVGHEYNFRQLLEFIYNHYYYVNGRLLCMSLLLVVHMIGGLKGIQVFMATSILLITILSYGIVLWGAPQAERHSRFSGIRKILLAAFLCLLYGSIGIHVHRLGTYWYAASFLYVVPAVTFLCFVWLYFKTDREPMTVFRWIFVCLLAFLGAFSSEQWLVAVISFVLILGIWRLCRGRRPRIADGAVLLCALAGAMPILTSPAIRYRMEANAQFAELGFWEKISGNIVLIIRHFFSAGNKLYVFTLLLMLVCMELLMLKRKKGKPTLHLLFLAATAVMGVYEVWQLVILRSDTGYYPQVVIWLLFFYVLWMSGQILYYLFSVGKELQALIYAASFFSMACMVIVPEIPLRSMLPFIFLSFSSMGTILWMLLQEKLSAVPALACILVIGKISVSNLKNIYIGYHANYLALQYNDERIRECSERIWAGETIKEVKLYQVPNWECAGEMVYNPQFSYMFYWMTQYYSIPGDLYLNYEAIPDIEILKALDQ